MRVLFYAPLKTLKQHFLETYRVSLKFEKLENAKCIFLPSGIVLILHNLFIGIHIGNQQLVTTTTTKFLDDKLQKLFQVICPRFVELLDLEYFIVFQLFRVLLPTVQETAILFLLGLKIVHAVPNHIV